jgi:hypothetical protein
MVEFLLLVDSLALVGLFGILFSMIRRQRVARLSPRIPRRGGLAWTIGSLLFTDARFFYRATNTASVLSVPRQAFSCGTLVYQATLRHVPPGP